MSAEFDVVIIGSGAGGAPVAERLASAGAKVLLVERGPRYSREQFDRDEIEWCRRDRFVPSPKSDPHMRRTQDGARAIPTTDGWISTVLGGGTVHMGGYMLRAHEDDARQGTRLAGLEAQSAVDWPLPFDDVARLYPVVEREIGVSGAPDGAMPPLSDHPLGARVDEVAKQSGLSCIKTPRGILTQARPDEDRRVCGYHDLCASYGCPDDAKASMSATYLRRAERTKNLTVWTDTRALELIAAPDKKSAAGVRVFKKGQGQLDVKARVVVVACGAIESARLLLLSGAPFNPGGQVGKNLWFSLFVEATGFFDKVKHSGVEQLMAGSPFLNRTLMHGGHLPSSRAKATGLDRTGTLQLNFVHDNPIHRAERTATEGGLVWGAKLKESLKRAFTGGRTVVVEGFGESVPHPGAYIDLDPRARDALGKPVARITYSHHPRDTVVAKEMAKDAAAVLQAMGADDVRVTRALSETTVLQGGTCRMGTSPENSVIGPDGALHGLPNVFVTDGGALPSSTTVPITLTLVANALRTAEHIQRALAG